MAEEDPAALVALIPSLSRAASSHAAEILGELAPPSVAIPALAALIAHASPLVREGAVEGLRHHPMRAAKILRGLADDPSPGVRAAVADVLEDL